MREELPNGVRGFLFAASIAGFMSTIATQLNWGTAYLVNDLFRRFIFKNKHEAFYVTLARFCTIICALLAIAVTSSLTSITQVSRTIDFDSSPCCHEKLLQAWELVILSSAGVGTVLIGRWYWWRINAWSEITATVVPIILAVIDGAFLAADIHVSWLTEFPGNLYFFVTFTTICWILVTFQTDPVSYGQLDHFYKTVGSSYFFLQSLNVHCVSGETKRPVLGSNSC
jgi:Na+/proline symporter